MLLNFQLQRIRGKDAFVEIKKDFVVAYNSVALYSKTPHKQDELFNEVGLPYAN